MLNRISTRIRRGTGGPGPWILASAVALALLVSPFAIAATTNTALFGGARNPSDDQRQALTKETEIIASTSTYGTRQSNKSDNGGGAIYGCRSGEGGTPKGNEPCIRANNLAKGRAFEFTTGGLEVGRIESADPAAKPFTTNAGGVADGLNADKVDGQNATDITTAAITGGINGAKALNQFAVVSATGTLGAGRGVDSAARTALGLYTVTFKTDVSACALSATEATIADGSGAATVAPASATTIQVRTNDGAGVAADRPFHLTVIC